MGELQQVSIYRKNPLPKKPHIYFDGYWQYSLPKSLKKYRTRAKDMAWDFVNKLNTQKKGRLYAYHDSPYSQPM